MLKYPPTAHKCVRSKYKGEDTMAEPTKYYVVTKKAVPDVLLQVVEAKRLLKFLDYFLGVDSTVIPDNSLLREFIGGGCFRL